MSVAHDMLRAYRAPRAVFTRRLTGARGEAQGLAILMAACILIFASQAPILQREAFETGEDFQPMMGGAMFAWLFIAPLVAYVLGSITHLVWKIFGGKGSGFSARLALFWALLVASPLWLLNGLVAGFVGEGPALTIVGIIAFAAFLVHWAINLAVAERGGAA